MKKKKNKVLYCITLLYLIILICLLLDGTTELTPYGYLAISFYLVLAGTHGLIHKYNSAVSPPRGPVINFKVSYKDDNSFNGIMGRIGNILAIIIGIVIFSLIF